MSKIIVMADDSSTLRMAMKAPLVAAGYTVLEAEDGVKGLALIENNHVDLLITDLNMPEMDGMELSTRVRNIESKKFLPILMLTTEGGTDLKERAKSIGLTAWLTKPFNADKLLSVVQKVLK